MWMRTRRVDLDREAQAAPGGKSLRLRQPGARVQAYWLYGTEDSPNLSEQ